MTGDHNDYIASRYDPGDPPDEDWFPTDVEMIQTLDAYGHLTWGVGTDSDEDEAPTTWADYNVFLCPERDVVVAWHLVFDGNSFCGPVEGGVEEVARGKTIGRPILEHAADAINEAAAYDPEPLFCDPDEVEEVQARFDASIRRDVDAAWDLIDAGDELPISTTWEPSK